MPTIKCIDGEKLPEDCPIVKRHADIVLNPSGVINRLNPSQLIEEELNFVSQIIRYRMWKLSSLELKFRTLINYLDYVNERESLELHEFYNSLDDNQKEEFINEIITNGIPINQEPFWNNISFDQLAKIYDHFNIVKYDLKNITQPLVMGELYFLRLKHDPSDKFSARSVDNNNFKDLPTKSRVYKDSKAPYSNTPIRLGEMEVSNLGGLAEDGYRPILELLSSYANNTEARQNLIRNLLTTNPLDPHFDLGGKTVSNNQKILNASLAGLGIEIINSNGDSNIKKLYKNENYKHEEDPESNEGYNQFIIDKIYEE